MSQPERGPSSSSTTAAATPHITGACTVTLSYDVGFAIDLEHAQRLLAPGVQRESLKGGRRAPTSFQFRPAPLMIPQAAEAIQIAGGSSAGRGWTTGGGVGCVIYDFGAVSVTYRIPLDGPLDALLELSDALYDNAQLLADSRRRVDRLLDTIRPAVSYPLISELIEDYAVYQFETITPAAPTDNAAALPHSLITAHARTLAQILRAERQPLSDQETADALAARISYTPDDAAIIDFNAAILFLREDHGAADVRDVLEFANVELLEMRFLDDRLDAALDRAYRAMSRHTWRTKLSLGSEAADLARIARLQVDGAQLFEGVNNALKLIGDQYLARVYRLAAQRFHLPEWDASILRKLQTVESIYQKLSDRQSNRRMELLEWIIIALIAIEIGMAIVRR